MLSGCDSSNDKSMNTMLRRMSLFNDNVQALLFNPNEMAPTYPESMITRRFPFWSSRLPHGNSKNMSCLPRLAFYVSMNPIAFQQLERYRAMTGAVSSATGAATDPASGVTRDSFIMRGWSSSATSPLQPV